MKFLNLSIIAIAVFCKIANAQGHIVPLQKKFNQDMPVADLEKLRSSGSEEITAFVKSKEPDEIWGTFRGLRWGQSLPEDKKESFIEIENKGKMLGYSKNDDQLKIGDAELSSIEYVFYENMFSFVIIQGDTKSNYDALLKALDARYGKHIKDNEFIEEYKWLFDKKTEEEVVLINLKLNQFSDKFTLFIGNVKLNLILGIDDKIAAKKGAKSDF